nr:UDP-glucose/GDP-mannose dehydrogenase family protein [Bacteroidota bacterium]
MIIGIVGIGTVGFACKVGFEGQGHKVLSHDIRWNTTIDRVKDTEICFISVPTPSLPDGQCDVSIVEGVVKELDDIQYEGIICIKSTVVPGTTDKLRKKYTNSKIYFVPEFLREKCAVEDFIFNNKVLVIGAEDEEAIELIKKAHGLLPIHTVPMKIIEAELMKYFSNSYKAMRVTFANSFYAVCNELDANYDKIRDAFLFHGIGDGHYLRVNKEFGGFGGTCLPKDTRGLANLVDEL